MIGKFLTGCLYSVIHAITTLQLRTLDYRIAVGYQINVDLGIFPEINKRSLLNKCSLGNFLKTPINIALLISKNMLIRDFVHST